MLWKSLTKGQPAQSSKPLAIRCLYWGVGAGGTSDHRSPCPKQYQTWPQDFSTQEAAGTVQGGEEGI